MTWPKFSAWNSVPIMIHLSSIDKYKSELSIGVCYSVVLCVSSKPKMQYRKGYSAIVSDQHEKQYVLHDRFNFEHINSQMLYSVVIQTSSLINTWCYDESLQLRKVCGRYCCHDLSIVDLDCREHVNISSCTGSNKIICFNVYIGIFEHILVSCGLATNAVGPWYKNLRILICLNYYCELQRGLVGRLFAVAMEQPLSAPEVLPIATHFWCEGITSVSGLEHGRSEHESHLYLDYFDCRTNSKFSFFNVFLIFNSYAWFLDICVSVSHNPNRMLLH